MGITLTSDSLSQMSEEQYNALGYEEFYALLDQAAQFSDFGKELQKKLAQPGLDEAPTPMGMRPDYTTFTQACQETLKEQGMMSPGTGSWSPQTYNRFAPTPLKQGNIPATQSVPAPLGSAPMGPAAAIEPYPWQEEIVSFPQDLSSLNPYERDEIFQQQVDQLYNENIPVNVRLGKAQEFATALISHDLSMEASSMYESTAAVANRYEGPGGAVESRLMAKAHAVRGEGSVAPPAVAAKDLSVDELTKYLDRQVAYLKNDDLPAEIRLTHADSVIQALQREGHYLEAAVVYEAMAVVAHEMGDAQLEAELQFQADFNRNVDETGSAQMSAVLMSKEELERAIKKTEFIPARKILEARLALLNHDFKTARECLEFAGWNILLTNNPKSVNDPFNLGLGMDDRMFPPWKYDSKYPVPNELQSYWDQAKKIAAVVDSQETRENTLELLMIEVNEERFNLADDMGYVETTQKMGESEGIGDQIAYGLRTGWVLGGVNTVWEEGAVAKYEQRISFRNLLCFYLQSGVAENLDQAIDMALHDNTIPIPEEWAESKKNAAANYEVWKEWRGHHKVYGLGMQVIYDREKEEGKLVNRSDMDGYWKEQIAKANGDNNYDKTLMYLDTILEADLERGVSLIPLDERWQIIQDIEAKAKEEHNSIVNPIIHELERQYAGKRDELIAAVKHHYPKLSDDTAFAAGIQELAEQSFQQTVAQFTKEELKKRALTYLQKQGVYDDGPFSKELRQYALDEYKTTLKNKGEMDFQQKMTTMTLVNVPLIMCGGFVAGLARQGLRLAATAVLAEGATETSVFAVTEFVAGGAAEGWAFHTTSATMNMPIQGSAAFDNYWRESAISIGMMYTLGGSKLAYRAATEGTFVRNFATGEAQIVNGSTHLVLTTEGQAYKDIGEVAFESAAMTGYEHYVGETARDGTGSLEEVSLAQQYLDAVALVVALRGGQEVAGKTAEKIKRQLRMGQNPDSVVFVKGLAKQKIFLLKPDEYRNLAIRLGKPELADGFAYSDPATGNTFVNRERIHEASPNKYNQYTVPSLPVVTEGDQPHLIASEHGPVDLRVKPAPETTLKQGATSVSFSIAEWTPNHIEETTNALFKNLNHPQIVDVCFNLLGECIAVIPSDSGDHSLDFDIRITVDSEGGTRYQEWYKDKWYNLDKSLVYRSLLQQRERSVLQNAGIELREPGTSSKDQDVITDAYLMDNLGNLPQRLIASASRVHTDECVVHANLQGMGLSFSYRFGEDRLQIVITDPSNSSQITANLGEAAVLTIGNKRYAIVLPTKAQMNEAHEYALQSIHADDLGVARARETTRDEPVQVAFEKFMQDAILGRGHFRYHEEFRWDLSSGDYVTIEIDWERGNYLLHKYPPPGKTIRQDINEFVYFIQGGSLVSFETGEKIYLPVIDYAHHVSEVTSHDLTPERIHQAKQHASIATTQLQTALDHLVEEGFPGATVVDNTLSTVLKTENGSEYEVQLVNKGIDGIVMKITLLLKADKGTYQLETPLTILGASLDVSNILLIPEPCVIKFPDERTIRGALEKSGLSIQSAEVVELDSVRVEASEQHPANKPGGTVISFPVPSIGPSEKTADGRPEPPEKPGHEGKAGDPPDEPAEPLAATQAAKPAAAADDAPATLADNIFQEVYPNDYTHNRCYENIAALLKTFRDRGVDVSNAKILYLRASPDWRAGFLAVETTRDGHSGMWQTGHCVLELDGKIYDLDYPEPRSVSKDQYFSLMFSRTEGGYDTPFDVINVQALSATKYFAGDGNRTTLPWVNLCDYLGVARPATPSVYVPRTRIRIGRLVETRLSQAVGQQPSPLTSPDSSARWQAVKDLGALISTLPPDGKLEATLQVAEILGDKDMDVCSKAIQVLRNSWKFLGEDEKVAVADAVAAKSYHADPLVRRNIKTLADEFAANLPEEVRDLIKRRIKIESLKGPIANLPAEERLQAALELSERGPNVNAEEITVLSEALKETADLFTDEELLTLTDGVVKWLGSEKNYVRWEAVDFLRQNFAGLSRNDQVSLIKKIAPYLKSNNQDVRQSAINALKVCLPSIDPQGVDADVTVLFRTILSIRDDEIVSFHEKVAKRLVANMPLANGTIILRTVPSELGGDEQIRELRELAIMINPFIPDFQNEIHNRPSSDNVDTIRRHLEEQRSKNPPNEELMAHLERSLTLAEEIYRGKLNIKIAKTSLSEKIRDEISWPSSDNPTLEELGTFAISIRNAFDGHSTELSSDDRYALMRLAISSDVTAYAIASIRETEQADTPTEARKLACLVRVMYGCGYGDTQWLIVAQRFENISNQWDDWGKEEAVRQLKLYAAQLYPMLEDFQQTYENIYDPMVRHYPDALGLSETKKLSYVSDQYRVTGIRELSTHLDRLEVTGGNQEVARQATRLLRENISPVPFTAYLYGSPDFPSDLRFSSNKGGMLHRSTLDDPEHTPAGFELPKKPPGYKLTEEDKKEIRKGIQAMAQKCGKTWGKDLLVSVRSGGSISMPGQMLTKLNLGNEDQVFEYVQKVYDSWNEPGAKAYRLRNGIPDIWGTTVQIVEMKDGTAPNSGSGVASSTIDIKYGKRVSGDKIVDGAHSGKDELPPDLKKFLQDKIAKYEDDLGYPVQIEFTVENGHLWVLQIKKAPLEREQEIIWYAQKVRAGKISRDEAMAKLGGKGKLEKDKEVSLLNSSGYEAIYAEGSFGGGKVYSGIIATSSEEIAAIQKSGALAVYVTDNPDAKESAAIAMQAGAVIVAGGNPLAHLFDVARHQGLTYVGGVENAEGLKAGKEVTIDPKTGRVYAGHVPMTTGVSPVLGEIEYLLGERNVPPDHVGKAGGNFPSSIEAIVASLSPSAGSLLKEIYSDAIYDQPYFFKAQLKEATAEERYELLLALVNHADQLRKNFNDLFYHKEALLKDIDPELIVGLARRVASLFSTTDKMDTMLMILSAGLPDEVFSDIVGNIIDQAFHIDGPLPPSYSDFFTSRLSDIPKNVLPSCRALLLNKMGDYVEVYQNSDQYSLTNAMMWMVSIYTDPASQTQIIHQVFEPLIKAQKWEKLFGLNYLLKAKTHALYFDRLFEICRDNFPFSGNLQMSSLAPVMEKFSPENFSSFLGQVSPYFLKNRADGFEFYNHLSFDDLSLENKRLAADTLYDFLTAENDFQLTTENEFTWRNLWLKCAYHCTGEKQAMTIRYYQEHLKELMNNSSGEWLLTYNAAVIANFALLRPDLITAQNVEFIVRVYSKVYGRSDGSLTLDMTAPSDNLTTCLETILSLRPDLAWGAVEKLIPLVDQTTLRAASRLSAARALGMALALNPNVWRTRRFAVLGMVGTGDKTDAYYALVALKELIYRRPDIVNIDELIGTAASISSPEIREMFLAEAVEPLFARRVSEMNVEEFERIAEIFGDTNRFKYFTYLNAQNKEVDPRVREASGRKLSRQKENGAFPLQHGVEELLKRGSPKVLIVDSLTGGFGDEQLRTVRLIQSLLTYNPNLQITVLTGRPFSYRNSRVQILSGSNYDTLTNIGSQGYTAVVEFSEGGGMCADADIPLYIHSTQYKHIPNYRHPQRFQYDEVRVKGQSVDLKPAWEETSVYDSQTRLLAELGLPLVNNVSAPETDVFNGKENTATLEAWKSLTQGNVENRPVLILNPFGGSEPEKGFLSMTSIMRFDPDSFQKLAGDLVAKGYYVVIVPTDSKSAGTLTGFGTNTQSQALVGTWPSSIASQVSVVPDNDQLPSGALNYFVSQSNHVVTVEGGMVHNAVMQHKDLSVIMVPYGGTSGTTAWLPNHPQGRFRIITGLRIDEEVPDASSYSTSDDTKVPSETPRRNRTERVVIDHNSPGSLRHEFPVNTEATVYVGDEAHPTRVIRHIENSWRPGQGLVVTETDGDIYMFDPDQFRVWQARHKDEVERGVVKRPLSPATEIDLASLVKEFPEGRRMYAEFHGELALGEIRWINKDGTIRLDRIKNDPNETLDDYDFTPEDLRRWNPIDPTAVVPA